MGALYKGLIVTAILSLVAIAGVIHWLFGFGVPLRTTQGVAFTPPRSTGAASSVSQSPA